MRELDFAQAERDSLNANHDANGWTTPRLSLATDVIQLHILQGLAVTAGSAYGEVPPCREMCWTSFIEEHTKQDKQAIQMHKGGRAFTKHSHRDSSGWWGVSTGTNSDKNAMAERVFNLIWNGRTWANVFWLPHSVLAYEVRVSSGHGMRFQRDVKDAKGEYWDFRGFVEPAVADGAGHAARWRH
ncbi:hypothetical protein EMMF5_005695 [Cystobasidiomycetes sp. EMM_F5]